MRRLALPLSLLIVAALAAPATATPRDTTVRTIRDTDGDNLLEYAPGEDYTVIGADEDFRPPRDGSILNYLQLSDFQMVDEESPARVEFLDKTQRGAFNPFSSAYRPQESLTTQVTEAMVRAVRNTTSPVTSEQIELAILTGDNADSQQYNETRWFVDILDGTVGDRDEADLGTGDNVPPEFDPTGFEFVDKIDPNSGREGTCGDTNPGKYDGVKGGGDTGYYDPDASGPGTDGHGYSPLREENLAETPGRDVTVRDFPGLFEAAQEPFEAVGLDIPWYSAFGNHDALVQGNSPEAYVGPFGGIYTETGEVANPTFHAIATGCFKPDDSAFGSPDEETLFDILNTAPSGFNVPQDERRCFLAKDEAGVGAPGPCGMAGWIEQHFLTSGEPVGHGFAPAPCVIDQPPAQEIEEEQPCFGYGRPPQADAHNDGYYSFSPRPGLRFITLDTITDECGTPVCSEGSVDDTQFDWLKQQLQMAEASGEYAMVFSHHTLKTIRFPSIDATEQEGPEDPSENGMHYGQAIEHEDDQVVLPPQPANPTGGKTLEQLFCEFPNMLAHVAGHEHENYVKNHDCDGVPLGSAAGPSGAFGGFWHISTAAHIDYPQQSRMVELIDNMDETDGDPGTMSLVLTMLDHDGQPNPGGAKPDLTAGGQAGEQVLKLASIARELAYNDYHGSRGAVGSEPADRNAIIVLDRPWPYTTD